MSAKTESVEARTEALLLPLLEAGPFELVDVEFVKEAGTWYLRAYIDKEGGMTVDDCETISRALEAELDREDFIEESYILEVSSPGLGRPLKKEKDFLRAMGKEIEIHTYQAKEGSKEFFGELCAYDAASVTIRTENGEQTFSRKEISLIRMALDF